MGAYGHPVAKTPHFDAFAANATLFEVAYSSYPQCSPSRCALATARHPHVLGHRTMTHLLQPTEQNLWRFLRNASYTTVHIGKNDMLSAAAFPLSFDYWADGTGVSQGGSPYPFGEAGYYSFHASVGGSGTDPAQNGDLRAVRRALAFMASAPEPWAVFLPGIGAHPPYGAPKGYYDMYDPAALCAAAPLRAESDKTGPRPGYYGPGGIRSFRNITSFNASFDCDTYAKYLGRVSYTDYVFGELLAGLDALPAGKGARTAVAFSSDHGDFQGNWGLVEKWSGAGDDLLLRVPLAVRLHAAGGGAAGVRVAAPVQLFDLFPTFLELANFSTTDANYVHHGKSLLPQLRGQPNPDVHDYVFAEAGYLYFNEVEYNDPTQAATWADPKQLYYPRGAEEHLAPGHAVRFVVMRNASHKLIYRASRDVRGGVPSAPGEVAAGVPELYDMAADPRELNNVYGDAAYAGVRAAMVADLLDWFLLTADVTEDVYDSRGLPPGPTPPPAAAGAGARGGAARRALRGGERGGAAGGAAAPARGAAASAGGAAASAAGAARASRA